MKILITSQKGGVGKSTLAASLAASCAQQGACLLDLDPQATSSTWVSQQPRPGLQALHSTAMLQRDANTAVQQIKQALRAAERAAPLVVADLTWGRFLPLALLLEFDAVVVPVAPSSLELQSTQAFLHDCATVFNSMEAAAPQLVVVPYRVHTQHSSRSLVQQLSLPMQYELTPPVAFDLALLEDAGHPPYLHETQSPLVSLGFARVVDQLQDLISHRKTQRSMGGFAASKNLCDSRSRLNSPLTLLDQFMLNKQAHLTRSAHLAHERMQASVNMA